MKIAIIGTRGIPNNYGGFEQFAEYLAVGLAQKGHDVTVYNPEFHPFKKNEYKGVKIIRKWSPENKLGATANFIYDYLSLRDALKKDFDIIYEAGYGTNSPSHLFLNIHKSIIVTNMDGLEWQRAKWGSFTKKLMRRFEKLAVDTSHYLVADNIGIQKYIQAEYGKPSKFLAYGADLVNDTDDTLIQQYGLEPQEYYLLVARMEPENNIRTIVEGYLSASPTQPLICIGGTQTKHCKELIELCKHNSNVKFIGGIYDKSVLDSLRKNAIAYFHGHSVGGTNPSLLEAMASETFIIAHSNDFNRSVLNNNAEYFSTPSDVDTAIRNIAPLKEKYARAHIAGNLSTIKEQYAWDIIIDQYLEFFKEIYRKKQAGVPE